MTSSHTELCEKLRTEIESFKKAGIDPGELVPALAHIEELELEREQAVAEAQGYLNRIAELERERDALKADAERLDWLKEETCDLRCINVPTGGDDCDVRWAVVQHYMQEPCEREIGRSFSDDPRDAIDAALQAEKETRS